MRTGYIRRRFNNRR
jgi:hypothetical protein